MFPLINRKVPKAEARDRAEKRWPRWSIWKVCCTANPKPFPAGSSSVAIARALVKRPAVLLLDEPPFPT